MQKAASPDWRRAHASSARLVRLLITAVAGAAVAALAFAAVLWLTSPTPLAPEVAAMARATVTDSTSLMAAVQTAGLRGTADVRGAIDEIKRLDGTRVLVRGWAADAALSGSPLTVVVFAGRAHILTARGSGMVMADLFARSEVNAASTAFHGELACTRGERVFVVAITMDRRYSQFRSLACP